MPEETPLQRLRRLETAEKGGAAPGSGASRGKTAAAGGGLLLVLAKGKVVLLFLLGKLQWLLLLPKLAPFLGTLATMLVSIQIYSALYGSSLAAGLVALILLHELGHGAAAKALGLRVGAPIFIPFFGAVIAMKEQPRSTWVECRVAAAGPAAGLLGAAACAAYAAFFPAAPNAGLCLALAHITASINLFNLLPAAGLDGDRVTQPFERRHWRAALAALAAACAAASLGARRLDAVSFLVFAAALLKAWSGRPSLSSKLLDRLEQAGRYAQEDAETTPPRRNAAVAMYAALALALALVGAWTTRLSEERLGAPRPAAKGPNRSLLNCRS